MPVDSGLAFIVVQHLDPTHEDMLPELLQRDTKMPVRRIEDRMKVEPDHVYVISPGRQLSMFDGKLQSAELARHPGRHTTIDWFFRTLAETHGSQAIAVVLSGAQHMAQLGPAIGRQLRVGPHVTQCRGAGEERGDDRVGRRVEVAELQ